MMVAGQSVMQEHRTAAAVNVLQISVSTLAKLKLGTDDQLHNPCYSELTSH